MAVDMLEKSVLLYGRDLDYVGPIGGRGQGPREYQAPRGLAGLPDGRLLVQDVANGRFLVLNPDGSPSGDVISGSTLPEFRMVGLGGEAPTIDSAGRWYFPKTGLIQGGVRDGVRFDSVQIERWSGRAGDRSIVVATAPRRVRNQGPTPIGSMVPTIARPTSDWTACEHGTIYVAIPDPYSVIVYSPDGTVTRGADLPYTPVRVTEAFKQQWSEEVARTPATSLGTGPGGGRAVGYWFPAPREVPWPERLPPFSQRAVHCGPNSRAWVQRTVEPTRPPRVDVFDRSGDRVQRFDLPDGSRIVGFGFGSVYVVVRDEVDLEYVTRLQVPGG